MINFTNKTFKEIVTVSEGDVTMNGVIEYSAEGLRSANLSSICAGKSCGSASIDFDRNVQLYGFKIEDIEVASRAVANWMTEIKTHING